MFVKISDLLNKNIKKSGASEQVSAIDVLNEFNRIIEDRYAKDLKDRVKPLYIKNKTLTVSCDNQTTASELKLRERKIIQELNKGKKEPPVQTIRFLL
ncbi:DUF721 domain-containing protein [Patescibacteria group bacterium]|nr:MAG: DUF721 domain-containing protein [Patescibacteria group bacterium]